MTAHATAEAPAGGASVLRRIYGYGSVFGKALRDSRRATLVVGGFLAIILIAVTKAIVTEFATPASRQELGDVVRSVPPILQGLAGRPINVETLGGYVNYKYGTFFPLVASLWSILALSGTLASEARRGSLDLVAAAPISRRRIALEKLFGHIVPLTVAMVVVFLSLVFVGSSFAELPGDEITVAMAAGYTIWLMLLALIAGGLAFAIAPFLGRGAAIGISGALMFAGFILNGYQVAVPDLAPFANLTWFGWTTNHLPLAGQYDWPSVILVGIVALILFVIGVEAFARRDIGVTGSIPTPSLPRPLVGLHGPVGRAFGDALPSALAWGLGIGLFGLVMAASGRSFEQQLQNSPQFMQLLNTIFPDVDFSSTGAFLQLVFVQFGLVLAGLAAATLVARFASDEPSGRLELLLATPLSRVRWLTSGAVAVLAAIVVIVALTAAGIGIGAVLAGGDVATPVLGTLVLGLFAIALAGFGIAAGGIFGMGVAAPVAAILTIAFWFVDIVVPALGLPDVVHELALSAHYGAPLLGRWDVTGIIASIALGVAGVAIGAIAFRRRDLRS
jgi:ABC-2 type transport system permease protein